MTAHAEQSYGVTDAQLGTLDRLRDRLGEPDYVNRHKPSTAIYADWLAAEVMARITPDGHWENVWEAMT